MLKWHNQYNQYNYIGADRFRDTVVSLNRPAHV